MVTHEHPLKRKVVRHKRRKIAGESVVVKKECDQKVTAKIRKESTEQAQKKLGGLEATAGVISNVNVDLNVHTRTNSSHERIKAQRARSDTFIKKNHKPPYIVKTSSRHPFFFYFFYFLFQDRNYYCRE